MKTQTKLTKPKGHKRDCSCNGCAKYERERYWASYWAKVDLTKLALKTEPTREKPVFVRAYWRAQPNWVGGRSRIQRSILDSTWSSTGKYAR